MPFINVRPTDYFVKHDSDFNGKLDAQEAKNAREDGCIWAQEGQDKEAFNKARLEHISELLSTPERQEELRKTDEKFRQLLKESKEKEENQQEQETKKSRIKIYDPLPVMLYKIVSGLIRNTQD